MQDPSEHEQPEQQAHDLLDAVPAERTDTFIVGIGASAGGLEALETLFDSMPTVEHLAFVIVQHLSPNYKSLMPELLSRHTKMPISIATDGLEVQPGGIYLIPPKTNLSILNGTLFLIKQEQGLNLPIDIFLRSLAEDQGERAVGIILSGTGSDGTRGIRAIKEAGGMVMVQNEETAKFDGMPRSAILTGIVDFVLPPERIPDALIAYTTGRKGLSSQFAPPLASGELLGKILLLIKNKTNIDFSFYKQSTVVRRIERRMGVNQISQAESYIHFLEESPTELYTLYKEILIGVTKFFRDPEAFEVIKEKIIPEIVSQKAAGAPLRVWVAGCSTGEEAYSLAIIFSEYLEANNLRLDLKIFATDIDKDALDFASAGIYTESIAADISLARLGKYFSRKNDAFQIKPNIREKVIFAFHNIVKDPPFARIDLISCRNLLIYFQQALQKKVMTNFLFSMNQNAFLFLGTSETVGEFSLSFSSFDIRWKIYRNKGGIKPIPQPIFASPQLQLIRSSMSTDALPLAVPVSRPYRELEQVFERIIESHLPPCVIANQEREVVHIFGNVSPFLSLPTGKMNLDILKMAHKDLSIPLGTALQRAQREEDPIAYNNILINAGKTPIATDLRVDTCTVSGSSRYFIITFGSKCMGAGTQDSAIHFTIEDHIQRRIQDLEQELQHTKENLQTTIEELETSNEELQATNEELLSSNEELQSTNEELQSVNEELITVNNEYQKKIEELTELHDDMNNLLATTDIGTIFLDLELTIRKFTQPLARQINILPTDIGRPITDLSHELLYSGLADDVAEVLRSQNGKEHEIQTSAGQWYRIKIQPYQTKNEQVAGVVITLVNITSRKHSDIALTLTNDLMLRVLESSPIATFMLDDQGIITYANARAEAVLGIPRSELKGGLLNSATIGLRDAAGAALAEDMTPFALLKRANANQQDLALFLERPGKPPSPVSISANPIFRETGEVDGAVVKIETLTANPASAGPDTQPNAPDA